MIIESIKKINKFTYKILTDTLSFRLYFNHFIRYEIEEGMEISDEVYEEIKKEILIPSARRKAMDLLLKMDQSEKELRRKLALKDYPLEVIDEALSYVKKFNYINDERYAQNYVSYRSSGKSKRQVKMELELKGIGKEEVSNLVEEMDEEEAIDQLLKRKTKGKSVLDREEGRKLMAFLYRKGFASELVQSKVRAYMRRDEF